MLSVCVAGNWFCPLCFGESTKSALSLSGSLSFHVVVVVSSHSFACLHVQKGACGHATGLCLLFVSSFVFFFFAICSWCRRSHCTRVKLFWSTVEETRGERKFSFSLLLTLVRASGPCVLRRTKRRRPSGAEKIRRRRRRRCPSTRSASILLSLVVHLASFSRTSSSPPAPPSALASSFFLSPLLPVFLSIRFLASLLVSLANNLLSHTRHMKRREEKRNVMARHSKR